ncbi:MAG: hypothetical protein Rubg2KO_06670 [Rubricoccaceae bacterium]
MLVALIVLSITDAFAHPPASLVMDSQGTVYYSDLSHVWALASDGSKRVVVRDVHTHELWLDPDGNLYGEDVGNVGERYHHRVWRFTPSGPLTDVRPWREGHPSDHSDYSFARDSQGREYVLARSPHRVNVWERGTRIRTLELADQDASPGWLIVSPSGVTHITLGGALWRWAPEDTSAIRLAENLIERTDAFDFLHDRHALMGMWHGPEDEVYVSVFSGQAVKRIDSDGTVSVAARSTGDWSPVSGLIASDGAMWIQEFSTSNETRVRRIAADGTETLFDKAMNPGSPASSPSAPIQLNRAALGLGALLGVLALAVMALARRPRKRVV